MISTLLQSLFNCYFMSKCFFCHIVMLELYLAVFKTHNTNQQSITSWIAHCLVSFPTVQKLPAFTEIFFTWSVSWTSHLLFSNCRMTHLQNLSIHLSVFSTKPCLFTILQLVNRPDDWHHVHFSFPRCLLEFYHL